MFSVRLKNKITYFIVQPRTLRINLSSSLNPKQHSDPSQANWIRKTTPTYPTQREINQQDFFPLEFVLFTSGLVPIHLLAKPNLLLVTFGQILQPLTHAYLIYLRLRGNWPTLTGRGCVLNNWIQPCCTTPALPRSSQNRYRLVLNFSYLGHINFSFKIISRVSDLLILITKSIWTFHLDGDNIISRCVNEFAFNL